MPFSADLSDLAGRDDDEIPLAESALRIAAAAYPNLDPAPWLREIERLAERAAALARGSGVEALLDAANGAMFVESNFHGNTDDYYDPRNSFLNDVLERRMGIPITLSVIYIEIGRILGLDVRGVGFPGHFLVGVFGRGDVTLVDPFNRGARLGRDDCAKLVEEAGGDAGFLDESFFEPVGHRQILLRMLTNLKLVYVRRKEYDSAVAAIDRILQLQPDAINEVRDRGLVRMETGNLRLALTDLEYFIDNAPPGADRERVVSAVAIARRELARYN
jgi:regulator of sirC expression with transglutaminase-like and TPR domain